MIATCGWRSDPHAHFCFLIPLFGIYKEAIEQDLIKCRQSNVAQNLHLVFHSKEYRFCYPIGLYALIKCRSDRASACNT